LLPFGRSYAIFMGTTAAMLMAAVACVIPGSRERLVIGGVLLLSPAASMTAVTGQNAFLVLALLLAGVAMLERRPLSAGLLFAAATVKPQFCLMAPVALIAARNGRAMAAMVAGCGVLIGASLLLFGTGPWQGWLDEMLAPPLSFQEQWRQWSVLWGDDVFACASLLGTSDRLAALAQIGAAFVAAGAVFWCFARRSAHPLRLPLILAATALASPHLQGYDMILLSSAALAFFAYELDEGIRPGDAALVMALWVMPIFNPPRVIPVGFLTPPIEAAFILVLLSRMGAFERSRLAIGIRP
jgi:alpha-1,2-mannosyltransferase